MSVPKSKRNTSTKEYDETFFIMYRKIVDSVESHFRASDKEYQNHKLFIDDKSCEMLRLADDVLREIRLANSIFPKSLDEYNERRSHMTHAIGLCYAIITQYQVTLRVLKVRDDKFIDEIDSVQHQINSLKNWRKSDNHFIRELK